MQDLCQNLLKNGRHFMRIRAFSKRHVAEGQHGYLNSERASFKGLRGTAKDKRGNKEVFAGAPRYRK